MSEILCLRPHHCLCAGFFVGKGYNEEFVRNMSAILGLLKKYDPIIRLTEECDIICSCCPNRTGKKCVTNEKVRRIDKNFLNFCGLEFGQVLRWSKLESAAEIISDDPEKIRAVCGDCSWISICLNKL